MFCVAGKDRQKSPLVRLVDRYFVWVVVFVGILEVFGQALDSLVQGHLWSLMVWVGVGAFMLVGIYALETVKSKRSPS